MGTDGVLLGAWVNIGNATHLLDVGTGTGVIALLLAQRCGGRITGIEPDHEAFLMARQNAEESPWKDRIQMVETPLQDFYSKIKFDLAVCNPPFFENSLKPPTSSRQQQRHTDTLSQIQLIENVVELLRPAGRLAVILPTMEGNRFKEMALAFKLHLHSSCAVFAKIGKPQERWLLAFGLQPVDNPAESTLNIMDASGKWTEDYKNLTREFYLNF